MKPIPINIDTSSAVILDLIHQLKIKDVMSTRIISALYDTPLRTIQHIMRSKSITGIPIVTGNRLLGIVSMDDIITAFDDGHIEEKAGKHMTRNLIVLEEDMPISLAISYFDNYPYHRYPVLNKEKELVGMVTTRDITTRLLVDINLEVDRIEQHSAHTEPAVEEGGTQKRVFSVVRHNFEKAGFASTEIKKFLKSKNIDNRTIRRAAVASYELEINLVVHSNGGTMTSHYTGDKLILLVEDQGPGIEDIEKALEEGFSTANSWIRSLGFGAGMGLPNVKRVADEFSIESVTGKGTTVRVVINLLPQD